MMKSKKAYALLFLRLTLGWLFFYAGITKILNPAWSAEGYLKGAKTFTEFYQILARPDILSIINPLNAWGLTLIGAALILGIWMKKAAWLGIALMALYYIPILNFPYAGEHSIIVDEHIIYIGAFLVLIACDEMQLWKIKVAGKKK